MFVNRHLLLLLLSLGDLFFFSLVPFSKPENKVGYMEVPWGTVAYSSCTYWKYQFTHVRNVLYCPKLIIALRGSRFANFRGWVWKLSLSVWKYPGTLRVVGGLLTVVFESQHDVWLLSTDPPLSVADYNHQGLNHIYLKCICHMVSMHYHMLASNITIDYD